MFKAASVKLSNHLNAKKCLPLFSLQCRSAAITMDVSESSRIMHHVPRFFLLV